MIRITPQNFELLSNWYNEASQSHISRFLTSDPYLQPPTLEDFVSEWRGVAFISTSHKTNLRVYFDRSANTTSILLHSLASNPQRRFECAQALKTLLTKVLIPLRPRRVTCGVHSTNDQSLKLMSHIFGPPWGVDPQAYWDRELGDYVDAHKFSADTNHLINRFKHYVRPV